MKKIYSSLFAFWFVVLTVTAQISQQSWATQGGTMRNDSIAIILTFTQGQPFGGTLKGGANILTVGFQQPERDIHSSITTTVSDRGTSITSISAIYECDDTLQDTLHIGSSPDTNYSITEQLPKKLIPISYGGSITPTWDFNKGQLTWNIPAADSNMTFVLTASLYYECAAMQDSVPDSIGNQILTSNTDTIGVLGKPDQGELN